MPQLISIGYPQQLIQNQVYALPSEVTRLSCDDITATFTFSNDPAFGTSVNINPAANGIIVDNPMAFVKCTNKNITIRAVRWQ